MPRPTLTPDVCWVIATLSDVDTCVSLLRMSQTVYLLVCPLIYRHLLLGFCAKQAVHSMAENSRLPGLSLFSQDQFHTHVDAAEWAFILPALCNLNFLIVGRYIPLPRQVIPHLIFRLKAFGSSGDVVGPWAELIAAQAQLEELIFDCDFFGAPPTPQQLPRLRAMKGRPEDLAKFAQHYHLRDLWFFQGPPFGRRTLRAADLEKFALSPSRLYTIRIRAAELSMLYNAAPEVVATLGHIVLDEDLDWYEYVVTMSSLGGAMERVVAAINLRRHPLGSLMLVCSRNSIDRFQSRPLLRRSDAVDGVATWTKWGQPDEQIVTLNPSILPWTLDFTAITHQAADGGTFTSEYGAHGGRLINSVHAEAAGHLPPRTPEPPLNHKRRRPLLTSQKTTDELVPYFADPVAEQMRQGQMWQGFWSSLEQAAHIFGHTDGEEPERGWVKHVDAETAEREWAIDRERGSAATSSTDTMQEQRPSRCGLGPGERHESLDDGTAVKITDWRARDLEYLD
ncbi:hypothetical protein B0H11DRAFT_1915934 [Mycena galericulata]|nr:hypothetical protein B0H11DRAFT_1915934 [Mycena galericulata]